MRSLVGTWLVKDPKHFSIGSVPQRTPLSTMILQPWEVGSWTGLSWRANILCSASWMAREKELSWPSLLPVGFSKTFQMCLSSGNILVAGNNALWGLVVWTNRSSSERGVLKCFRACIHVSRPCPSLVWKHGRLLPLMGSRRGRGVGIVWMHWCRRAEEQLKGRNSLQEGQDS